MSLEFANRVTTNAEMVGILFVMAIDPKQSAIPFASIVDVSCFQGEKDEVLFSMHTVFRIGEITLIGGNNRLFQVNLTLTSDNDEDLRALTDYIREKSSPNAEGWYRLGSVLLTMGQLDKAQAVYDILLGQAMEESEKAPIYVQLGLTKYNQEEYTEAIKYYEKALEINEKNLSHTDPSLAVDYNNIGLVYGNMDDYPKALSFYEKALVIQQQSLPPNHPDLAASYNNIGLVYGNMDNYRKALSSYEKALVIQQQSLPPDHPDLAVSYNNIGLAYGNMNDYPKALSSYEKALTIQQQSLPPNHPDLGISYSNIGLVCENMKNYSKACLFYERAVDIGQQSLPPNHPHLQKLEKNLEDVKKKL